jgi:shikimate kinase
MPYPMTVANPHRIRRLGKSPNAPIHWVLLGLMGTGKSVTGRALAERLELPLSDSDAALASATGLTARELRDRDGLSVLHEHEARHLLDATEAATSNVVCAAASVVDDPRCRAALQRPGVIPIWLRATAETLAQRYHNEHHRPVLGADPLAFFEHQISIRYPRYLALGAWVIDVDGLSVAAVVAGIARLVDLNRESLEDS